MMKKIILTGWNPGLNKVGLSKLLRDKTGMSLSSAKSAVDSILEDKPIAIQIDSEGLAESIFDQAIELGAIGKLES
ncbi:MAG: hypothetical protein ACRBHB_06560 [Arenicella sp.]